MEFSKEELKWIENHKDLIDNGQFFDLFLAANKFPHGNIFDRMQFPGKLNFILYKAKLNIFNNNEIPNRYFWACKDLTSIDLSKIARIGDSAFQSCSNLRDVILSNSLKSIGDYAFEVCISLEHVNLPYTLESIGYGAFSMCSNLKSVKYDGQLEQFKNLLKDCSSMSYFPFETIIQCVDITLHYEDVYKGQKWYDYR